MTKRCTKCGEVKQGEDFCKARTKSGLHSWCKGCQNEYNKARYAAPRPDDPLEFTAEMLDGPTAVCSCCGKLLSLIPKIGSKCRIYRNVNHIPPDRIGIVCAACFKILTISEADPDILEAIARQAREGYNVMP